MSAVGPMLRRLFEAVPAAGRGSPVLCLLLLMVAAVAYWSPLPKPESETTTTATGIGTFLSPPSATELPLLLKVRDTGQKIGLSTPHVATADEARDCREHGRGLFCDVVSEPTVDLPPGALVKVINRVELRQRVTGGSADVIWYQVQAIKPDGTAMLGADSEPMTGWAQSSVFLQR